MILSNAPEFIPWVIHTNNEQSFTEKKFFEKDDLEKVIKKENNPDVELNNLADKAYEEPPERDNESEVVTSNEVQLIEDEKIIDPDLVPTYTPVEYKKYGEDEYLRGYNSCKENESLEFSDRLEQLNNLIDTLKNEYVDISEFYDPIRELVVSAIESIMQIELSESKNSISSIVSTILEEIALEADGSIRIYLNPSDATLLKNQKSPNESPIKILSDPRLTKGSARAVMGDSIIENMKENRVNHIVNQILGEKKKKTARSLRKKSTSSNSMKPVKTKK
jgi:hypothetical protein